MAGLLVALLPSVVVGGVPVSWLDPEPLGRRRVPPDLTPEPEPDPGRRTTGGGVTALEREAGNPSGSRNAPS